MNLVNFVNFVRALSHEGLIVRLFLCSLEKLIDRREVRSISVVSTSAARVGGTFTTFTKFIPDVDNRSSWVMILL
jgi:hypothetical protein